MVSTYYVYQRTRDLAKTGTSGYQSLDEYNRDSVQVSNELAELLTDNYEGNGKVADALEDLLLSQDITTGADGILNIPTPTDDVEYLHLDSIGTIINNERVAFNKIMRNEVDMIMSSQVRKFNITKKHLGYYKEGKKIQLLPEQVYTTRFRFIRKPKDPVLAMDIADDGDYEVVNTDDTKDFEFAPFMANLIVYMMLEKLGVEMKEQILLEYANLGIGRGMLKTTPANT